MIQANFKLNDYGCTTNSNFLFCSLTYEWFKSKLFKKRTLSYITRHPIWHTTIFRSTRERDQLLVHHILFYVSHLTKSKDDDTQALKKTFFLTSWGRKKKRGQASLNFTHSFTRSLQKLHTRNLRLLLVLSSSSTGRKYFFEGHCSFFKKKK